MVICYFSRGCFLERGCLFKEIRHLFIFRSFISGAYEVLFYDGIKKVIHRVNIKPDNPRVSVCTCCQRLGLQALFLNSATAPSCCCWLSQPG